MPNVLFPILFLFQTFQTIFKRENGYFWASYSAHLALFLSLSNVFNYQTSQTYFHFLSLIFVCLNIKCNFGVWPSFFTWLWNYMNRIEKMPALTKSVCAGKHNRVKFPYFSFAKWISVFCIWKCISFSFLELRIFLIVPATEIMDFVLFIRLFLMNVNGNFFSRSTDGSVLAGLSGAGKREN